MANPRFKRLRYRGSTSGSPLYEWWVTLLVVVFIKSYNYNYDSYRRTLNTLESLGLFIYTQMGVGGIQLNCLKKYETGCLEWNLGSWGIQQLGNSHLYILSIKMMFLSYLYFSLID